MLVVLALSDSFAAAWEPLARGAGLALQLSPDPSAAVQLVQAGAASLVAAGGVEERSADAVRRLATAGAPPAVAGARPEHRLAVALLAAGAADYFALPGDLPELEAWLRGAARDGRLTRGAAWGGDAAASGGVAAADPFAVLVGRGAAMRELIARARRVAAYPEATVLLTGETGTGKGLVAEAIHRAGARAPAPFVEVNCAALPAALLEAELFGHEKGAFTDARAAKPGLVEHAAGGTLFLDEIGDLPPALQGKLLTVLERRRLRRLGGLAERAVDVRVMAATHVELAAAVRARRFRADLYFRLDVVALRLPALRERGDDAVLLAEHFARALAARHGTAPRRLDAADRDAVRRYAWPGNVRELRNAVERATVCGDPLRLHVPRPDVGADGAARTETDAGVAADEAVPAIEEVPAALVREGRLPLLFPAPLRRMEREAARVMVARCSGNKSRAAAALGISRKRLYLLLASGGGDGAATGTT